MRLEHVYARFFRSLNYDYLRKAHDGYSPDPWDDTTEAASYPFVRLALDPAITAIVGANESGKSQLLAAVRCGLTGERIERRDFCRYSPFFSAGDALDLPEFGLEFGELNDAARGALSAMCADSEVPGDATRAAIFRVNATPKLRCYFRADDGAWSQAHHVRKPAALKDFGLPACFEIDASIPLPDAVPLDYLATGDPAHAISVEARRQLVQNVLEHGARWFASENAVQQSAAELVSVYSETAAVSPEEQRQFQLADDLLIKVVSLDRATFRELKAALEEGRNGYAGAIVDTINDRLAARLNLAQWWSQDSRFELRVEARGIELVFVITDRTGRTYSFDERSQGLKYFLSYFVQYLAHEPPADGQPELLLMDEPDAYLSASGQQDLLRIFAAFAHPAEPGVAPVQVVYVTHSPFLIDKNHAERIRVVEKGEHDEGTRVVRNASRNHYEPLRSAFGAFVGESAFIGTCNLLLEGTSDQVLIAGASSWLARRGASSLDRLDLNRITLVPAGSASHVPYVAFLARGRDVEQPAVIVLLDGDEEGSAARRTLARGGPRAKQLVAPDLVLQLNDDELEHVETANPTGLVAIEDLLPVEVAVAAVVRYCAEYLPEVTTKGFRPSADAVFTEGRSMHAGMEHALRKFANDAGLHLDKVGFARSVVAALDDDLNSSSLDVTAGNFKLLLGALGRRQRQADRALAAERIRSRVGRVGRRFLADHPHSARRQDALVLREEIEGQLDLSVEADEVRARLRGWVRDHRLEEDPSEDIGDFTAFRRGVEQLPYVGTLAVQT